MSISQTWGADYAPAQLRDSRQKSNDNTNPTVRRLVDEYSAQVWRTLRYFGVASADLHDACQDVFLVIYRKLDGFEHRSSMRTWVYGICARVASSYRRTQHRRHEDIVAEPPELPVLPTQLNDVEEQRVRERLLSILDRLDPEKREVFVLFEVEERPMAEIANTLACPLRTVYSRLEAARKQIAREWHHYELQERLR